MDARPDLRVARPPRPRLRCLAAAGWLLAALSCREVERPPPLGTCAAERAAAGAATAGVPRFRALRELGRCLATHESSERAAGLLRQAADGFGALGAAEERAETLLALGLEELRLAQAAGSERSLATALGLFEELDRPAGVSRAHLLLGELFQNAGAYERALEHLRSGLEVAESAGLEPEKAHALQKLGSFYTLIGYTEEALDELNRALAIQRRLEDDGDLVGTLTAIGWVHYLDLDPRDCLPYYSEALALARSAGNQSAIAGLLDRLASAHRALGDLDSAEEAYRRSLAISRRLGRPAWQAHTLSNLARLMLARDRLEEALPLLDEGLRLMREAGDLNGALTVQLDRARAERRLGRPDRAMSWLEEALAGMETLRGAIAGEDSRALFVGARWDVYEEAIDLCFERWESSGDRRHLLRALELTERARARGLFEGLGTAPLTAAAQDREAAERLQALADERRRETARWEELARSGAHTARLDAVERRLRRLALEADELRDGLRRELARDDGRGRLDAAAIVALAEPGTALLVYALGDSRSLLFVVRDGRVEGFVLPARARIEALAAAALRSLEDGAASTAFERRPTAPRLAALARATLGPAADLLDAERLAVVPDGALAYVPFDVLPRPHPSGAVEPGAEPILVGSEVVVLPSLSVLDLQRRLLAARPPAPRSLIVFADPVYTAAHPAAAAAGAADGTPPGGPARRHGVDPLARVSRDLDLERLADLPHTAKEAARIARHAGAGSDAPLLVLGFDANRERFFAADLAGFRNVHFAGHGLFDAVHPELSGLVFSLRDRDGGHLQGLVHPAELRDLELNAELITLSACRTAWGREVEGEGLLGVTRGLLGAGARRVLVSSWSVDDAATAELMDRFYAAYLGAGLTPAAALRSAKLSMRADPAWSRTVYWGAFSLYGDWRDARK